MSVVIRDEGDDIDEEAEQREASVIERLVSEFVDEPSVVHNVYPESDNENEEGDEAVHRQRNHIRRGDGRLYKDQTFFNGVAFKEAVVDYALRTGRNIKQYRYDKDKIGFKCVGGGSKEAGEECVWQVYASTLPNDAMWRVRLFIDKHSCVPNGECELLKVPQIARLFVDKIREEPEYFMPMKIEEIIFNKWKIVVSRPQCQAPRNKCLRWIEWEYDQQFARLRDYAAELLDSNENSTVVVDCVKNDKGQDLFDKIYVCFDVIRRAWKESCRPLIGVDGTFVNGKIKGQVLVALGRDADNRIFPIAWGVVQVENFPNWQWFVRMLKADLDLNDGDGYIMVSDRQKIEHRMCVRHIYGNLKKKHGNKKNMKPFIWNLAWSYNTTEYEENLDRIENYDKGVWDDVMKSNPKSWCRAFYKKGNYCEDVENNSTESFNKTIKNARGKAFVPMLETIRRLAMACIATRSVKSHDHKGICTPYVAKFLAAEHQRASECIVTRSTNGNYEARTSDGTYRVDLVNNTCTCKKFEICGIPCEHAYGVIMKLQKIPEDYVFHWFRTSMWRRNYQEGPIPARSSRFWPKTGAPNVCVPPEPGEEDQKKKVTKADQKRKRGVNESPTKKAEKQKKRIMHCGICGVADHNSRFHKKNDASQDAQSSQPTSLSQPPSSQLILSQSSQAT